MNIVGIIVAAIVAYIVYVVLALLGLPSPFPMIVGLIVFVVGITGGNRWVR